jgi:hypothetical protein
LKQNQNKSDFFQGVKLAPAPDRWTKSCAHDECTLHQLSPYIGKIKSSIAGELVKKYSRPGDLVVDPFAGAGTIPLESALQGRRAFGADISPYAKILSVAKLFPPSSLDNALEQAEAALAEAEALPTPDLRTVPVWVRHFFHPDTLREALNFAVIARRRGNEFLMACFLGILHHQRPGFLSFPSSHLVPYLRDKKYPRGKFPEMYEYRALKPRLLAKMRRSFKRFNPTGNIVGEFSLAPVQQLELPERFDALISSPPYMNALDYGRDNRLRLWFIDQTIAERVDNDVTERRQAFVDAISSLGRKVESGLRRRGYCVFVVGEEVARRSESHPSEVVVGTFKHVAPSLRLKQVLTDNIPDIRRTRRECRGVKTEHILVFQRN